MTRPQPSSDEALALAQALLRSGRPATLVNLSGSLWPLVRSGDALTIDPAQPPVLGALAAVAHGPRLVVHRIVALQGDELRLKGDANAASDPPLRRADLLGVVTLQQSALGPTLDHTRPAMRLLNRAVALLSRRTNLPWRLLRGLRRRLR